MGRSVGWQHMVSIPSPTGLATEPGGLLTVWAHGDDPRATALTSAATALGHPDVRIEIADAYAIGAPLSAGLQALVVDPLIQHTVDPGGGHVVDVLLRAGVTDTAGAELQRAAAWLGEHLEVASGHRFRVHGTASPAELERLVRRLLANPVIEHWSIDAPLEGGATDADPTVPWHGQPASLLLALPPLSVVWLVPDG